MKKTLSAALGLLALASAAQYNNTYDVNLNNDNLTPWFVITNKLAESISVSYASDGPTLPRSDYFIVTKLDAAGNVKYNTRVDPFDEPTGGLTNVKALIETQDGGALIGGYHYDKYTTFIEQPFLVKVDVNGNVLWSKVYTVNQSPILNSGLNKLTLCRVADDIDENYFLVGSADSDANPGKAVTTNVIKVAKDGKLLFSKKYFMNTSILPAFIPREYPNDVEFSKDDKLYMIGGYREEVYSSGTTPLMFFFGIDHLGNVVTKYLTLASKSYPIDEDLMYDLTNKWFAVSFTHAKNGYTTAFASLGGFLTIDAGLTVAHTMFYACAGSIQNNSRSISACKNGNYVIGSDIVDKTTGFHNPGWLQIKPNGAALAPFLRYNIGDKATFGHHATSFNPSTGNDEFVMINEQNHDLRVIRTDANGKACGVVTYDPLQAAYTPDPKTYEYYPKDIGDYADYKVTWEVILPHIRECGGTGTSYRTIAAGVDEATASSQTMVYPSLLPVNNAQLTLMNATGAAASMTIHDISGKQIYAKSQLAEGRNDVLLNSDGRLAEGIYLVRVFDAAGTLVHSTKIVLTK